MTTIKAFNDLLEQFIDELVKTFPEEKKLIHNYLESFEMAKMANERMPLNRFMQEVSPYASQIMARDESFFTEHADEIDFLKESNMKKYWPDLSENTKGAMWQYLHTLYMLATTISALPADTMSMIENLAKQLEGKLSADGGIDETALMNSMMSMLQGPSLKKK